MPSLPFGLRLARLFGKKPVPAQAGLIKTLFGGTENYLKASKAEVHGALSKYVLESPDITVRKPGIFESGIHARFYLNEAGEAKGSIVWSGELYSQTMSQLGLSTSQASAIKASTFGHEVSEYLYAARDIKKAGLDKLSAWGRMKERFSKKPLAVREAARGERIGALVTPRFHTHQGPGVIVDELLLAAKGGPEAFQAMKTLRANEAKSLQTSYAYQAHRYLEKPSFSTLRGTVRALHQEGSRGPAARARLVELKREMASNPGERQRLAKTIAGVDKYIYRVGRITSTIEKNWVPRIPEMQGTRIPGSKDAYNTIEGLSERGLASALRKPNTDFGSGYRREDAQNNRSFFTATSVGVGGAAAIGTYLALYPWEWTGGDLHKYPQLAAMRRVGSKHGFRMLSPLAPRFFEEQIPVQSASELAQRAAGYAMFGELRATRQASALRKFQGLVYIQGGEWRRDQFAKEAKLVNFGNWEVGRDKLATWQHLAEKKQEGLHVQTLAGSDFYERHGGRIRGLSEKGRAFIKEAGGLENLVLKKREGARGVGVWLDAANLPSNVAEKFARDPEEFILQPRLDLREEFRVVTVGGKSVSATYRFGSPGVRKLAKKLGFVPTKEQAEKAARVSPFEVIQPVLNKEYREPLIEFAERAAKELPYQIGALDIGLTKGGQFTIIEAQRSFGNISNPITSRRIKQLVTGRAGIGAAIASITAGLGAMWAVNHFTGDKDAYNTVEGLPERGLARAKRQSMTDFGSGYQGPNENNYAKIGGAVGLSGLAAYMMRGRQQWINTPLNPEDYINRFATLKYQPGDIIFSRNVLYDDPFHAAIIGSDRKVYEAYPDKNNLAKVHQHPDIEAYLRGQLKLHGAEGLDYPLYGVARAPGLSTAERTMVGQRAVDLFQQYEAGQYRPTYGMRTNQGINNINCLSYISEAYSQAGRNFFKPNTSLAVPWNVDLGGFNWRVRGPEKLSAGMRFGPYASLMGAASLGMGIATADPFSIGYGTAALFGGFGIDRLEKTSAWKIGNLAGLAVSPQRRGKFRALTTAAAYAAITLPTAYKAMGTAGSVTSSNVPFISVAAGIAGVGLAGWAMHGVYASNKMAYSRDSKRLLILADRAAGTAAGHETPALAVRDWLQRYGWEADVVSGLDDLSKLQRAGRKYRAFLDAGYHTKWPRGLPGFVAQWDIQGAEEASKGKFRSHLRANLGLGTQGMFFLVPRKQEAEIYSNLVGRDVFQELGTLVVRPHVLKKAARLSRLHARGKLELPNIAAGEKYVTISGGGKGFGVFEATKTLQESGWLERTGHKAVVFSANLERYEPRAAAALRKLAEEDPARFILYNAEHGSPGLRLPEYMAGASVNLFAPGASTTAEAVASGRPFLGLYGGSIPDWPHFREHPAYAAERYGAITGTQRLPNMGQMGSAPAEMAENLDRLIERSRQSPVKRPMFKEFDIGKRLISLIEKGEASGALKPMGFSPSLQSLVFPLVSWDMGKNRLAWAAGSAAKTKLMFAAGLIGLSAFGYMWSNRDREEANTIPGMQEQGLAQSQREILTDFGSPVRLWKAVTRAADFLKQVKTQKALSHVEVPRSLVSRTGPEIGSSWGKDSIENYFDIIQTLIDVPTRIPVFGQLKRQYEIRALNRMRKQAGQMPGLSVTFLDRAKAYKFASNLGVSKKEGVASVFEHEFVHRIKRDFDLPIERLNTVEGFVPTEFRKYLLTKPAYADNPGVLAEEYLAFAATYRSVSEQRLKDMGLSKKTFEEANSLLGALEQGVKREDDLAEIVANYVPGTGSSPFSGSLSEAYEAGIRRNKLSLAHRESRVRVAQMTRKSGRGHLRIGGRTTVG